MENNNKNMEAWVGKLPQHSPPEELWNKIDSQLNSETNHQKLPIHEPKNEVWNEIENKLPKKRINFQFILRYGIAASLLIAGIFIFFHLDVNQSKPLVTIEKVDVEEMPSMIFNNQSVYEKLTFLCEINLNKCDTETYKVKEKSLQKIQVAIMEIEEMLSKFPNDNQLIAQNNYFRKLEADALRELILLTTKDI